MLASAILLLCLFLPLSQCSSETHRADNGKGEVSYKRDFRLNAGSIEDKFGKGSTWMAYIPGLFFIMPAVMVLTNRRNKHELLRYEFLEMFFASGVIAQLLLHKTTGTLLVGGWMALTSSSVYFFANIVEAIATLRFRWQQRKKT